MTDSQLTIIIAAIPPTLLALGAFINSLRNTRKIAEVHVATNGMKEALVKSTAKASKAEGKEEERTEERVRQEEAK